MPPRSGAGTSYAPIFIGWSLAEGVGAVPATLVSATAPTTNAAAAARMESSYFPADFPADFPYAGFLLMMGFLLTGFLVTKTVPVAAFLLTGLVFLKATMLLFPVAFCVLSRGSFRVPAGFLSSVRLLSTSPFLSGVML